MTLNKQALLALLCGVVLTVGYVLVVFVDDERVTIGMYLILNVAVLMIASGIVFQFDGKTSVLVFFTIVAAGVLWGVLAVVVLLLIPQSPPDTFLRQPAEHVTRAATPSPRVAVLLTMCVHTKCDALSSNLRRTQYLTSLEHWVNEPNRNIDLYVVESSADKAFANECNVRFPFVKFLSFDQNQCAEQELACTGMHAKKSQYEKLAMQRAVELWQTTWDTSYDVIFKITGKYYIPHLYRAVSSVYCVDTHMYVQSVPYDSTSEFHERLMKDVYTRCNKRIRSEVVGMSPTALHMLMRMSQGGVSMEHHVYNLCRLLPCTQLPPLPNSLRVCGANGKLLPYM